MKTKKGMTLIEIVISLGIYALLALLLTEIMSVVNSTMKATNQLNNRLSYQAKIADNQITSQSAPERSGSFALDMVYGNVDPATGELTTETHIGEGDPDAGTLTFNEWTVQAPVDAEGNPREVRGVNYAQDINYKFMTYAYPEEVAAEFPGLDFLVQVYLFPYIDEDGTMTIAEKGDAIRDARTFMEQVDSIAITGPMLDEDLNPHTGDDPIVYQAYTDDVNAAGNDDAKKTVKYSYANIPARAEDALPDHLQAVNFSILNQAEHVGERDEVWNEGATVTVHYRDASGNDILSFVVPRVYMFVKSGSTETYYQSAGLALDLRLAMSADPDDNDRAVHVGRSHTGRDAYSLADFIGTRRGVEPDAPEETPEEPDDEG